MNLTALLQSDPKTLNDEYQQSNVSRGNSVANGLGFDQYLSAMEKKDAANQLYNQRYGERDSQLNGPPRRSERKYAEKARTRNNENSRQTVKERPGNEYDSKDSVRNDKPTTEKTANKTDKAKQSESTEALKETVSAAEEEITAMVADVLNVPVDQIMQWLAELNLSPLDLTDPQAVAALLQKAFGVETTADLLTMPEFTQLFETINEFAAAYKELAAQSKAMAQLDGLQLTTNEANEPVVVMASTQTQAQTAQVTNGLTETAEEPHVLMTDAALQPTTQAVATQGALQQGNEQAGEQQENLPNDFASTLLETETMATTGHSFESMAARVSNMAAAKPGAGSGAVNGADIMNQIMNHVRMQSGGSFAELKITLRPENLGDVTLRVITQNGIVAAQFITENERVKAVLESNFNQLRDILQEQGVQVSELSVSVNQEDGERQMNQLLQARQQGRRRLQRIVNRSAELEDDVTVSESKANPGDVLANGIDVIA